jgi:uncharacterized protein DUF1588/uncharacterized protein DUF1592/uncharacterized protein DUF1587/uncharacterized protein DUF1595/uncharacterized protein DUF1585
MAMLLLGAAGFYGCIGDIGDGTGTEPVPEGASEAVLSGARRLTRTEYDNTLRDLLQDTTSSGFAKLPEDVNDPFDNDYHTQKVSPALIEAAETLATEAAARAMANTAVRDSIVPCTPSAPDDGACLAAFVSSFGRLALRRPLAAEEVTEYVAQFQPFSVEGNDFYIGVEMAITALLQDVEFLYRIELGAPIAELPGVFVLNDYEIATRLSYFLAGTTPPAWLLDLADQGQLKSPEGRKAAAQQLLAEDVARDRVDRFHALWLGYHQLPHPAALVAELRGESRALVEKVVFDDPTDYFDLFRSDQTYLTDELAAHYGYPAPGSPQWVTYPDERRGILSHGSVLSSFGKFTDTSPTQRGIFIRTRLMCQTIPKPPPNVDADNPPDEAAGNCKIDRYAQHTQGGCYDCHKMMDPIGFGLENYDNQGRYREYDDGKPECTIEGLGSIDGVGDFHGPAELAELMLDEGLLQPCVVKQVYRFAQGRREGGDDNAVLSELETGFEAAGYDFGSLLVDVVAHQSFGFRRQEEAE